MCRSVHPSVYLPAVSPARPVPAVVGPCVVLHGSGLGVMDPWSAARWSFGQWSDTEGSNRRRRRCSYCAVRTVGGKRERGFGGEEANGKL